MAYAHVEFDATDEAGNILTGVEARVELEGGGLISIFSDRAGSTPYSNPQTFADGHISFFAAGGAYKITLTAGAYTRVLRYKANGLLAEKDGLTAAAVAFTPAAGVAATTSQGAIEEVAEDAKGFRKVRVAATTNVAIATALENGDTVDGVALATGDLVLLTGQTAPAENGVYVVSASSAASRDGSFAAYNDMPGAYFSVMEGTAKADTLWRCTSNKGGTLGSTAIVVTEFTAGLSGLGATDNRLVRTDGTGGNAAQNSAISVDDSGNMSGVANLTANGNITAGGNAFFGVSTSFTSASAGVVGPDFTSYHNSASPAAADAILYWQMLGNDSGGNLTAYAILRALIEDPTNGSEDGGLDLQLLVAGANTTAMKIAPGLVLGAPTGGQKGIGTLNATAVYDDNTLLTCMALQEEFLDRGAVDLAKWDAIVPDMVVPGRVEKVPATFTESAVELVPVTEEVDGRLVRRLVEQQVEVEKPLVWADPVYDEEGNIVDAVETRLFDEVVTPEQTFVRTHSTARLFASMLAEGFDPRDPAQYISKLKADEALPGMPTRSTWEHNSLSGGEMFNRLWLATEMLAIVVMNLHERLSAIEAK